MLLKRKFVFFKKVLLVVLLSMQFFGCFGFLIEYRFSYSFLSIFCGYFFMLCFQIGNGHGRKVYLKYETGLSLIVKVVVINFTTMFFLLSCTQIKIGMRFFEVLAVFTILNLITVILINMLGNVMIRMSSKNQQEQMLFIYGESVRYGEAGNVEEILNGQHTYAKNNGKWLSVKLGLERLEQEIVKFEEVYLVDISAELRNDLMKICYEKGKIVFFTTKLSDILLRASGMTQDGDTPICYCELFGIGTVAAMIKRAFDIICSLLALFVLSPVFLIVVLLIKLEDGGPAIYKQTRCTTNQKTFQIYKFRSMRIDSEKDGIRLSVEGDARVTRIGKWIRHLKIDELPQLVNILKGDMSIVGPRPERPELIEQTIKEVPEFALRMKVKAGLTGYAQVRGCYNTDFLDKLKWDLMYIENYSFLLDIKIIIMTIFAIFRKDIL